VQMCSSSRVMKLPKQQRLLCVQLNLQTLMQGMTAHVS
jgi:hypothetical protein